MLNKKAVQPNLLFAKQQVRLFSVYKAIGYKIIDIQSDFRL